MTKALIVIIGLSCGMLAFQNCSPMHSQKPIESSSNVGDLFEDYEPQLKNNPFICISGTEPEPHKLRRMTQKEYINTVYDLFAPALSMSQVKSLAAEIPVEEMTNNFKNFNNIPSLQHIEAYFNTAERIADALSVSNTKLQSSLKTNCLAQNLNKSCLGDLAQDFLKRAYRRPLDSAEVQDIKAIYNEAGGQIYGVKALIQYVLNSPQFVYRLELGGTAFKGREDLLLLSPYEIASRISYFLTSSMPDEELFQAAENNLLQSQAQVLAQAKRLLSKSNRAKSMVRDFFEQWLKLKQQSLNYSTAVSKDIVTDSSLSSAAIEETHKFVEKTLWDAKGSFDDLIHSNKAYYSHSGLAKIYGVTGRGDSGVDLPVAQRRGLFTRAAFLMSGQDSTRPMHRGVVFQRNILCNSLRQPPPFPDEPDALQPPAFHPNKTTREAFHEKTDRSRCLGCHNRINPPAFAFEQFDSLARFRTTEEIIHSSGNIVNTLPIDTNVSLRLSDGSDVHAKDSIDLVSQVTERSVASACFVKKWVAYSNARESTTKDSCNMAKMYDIVNVKEKGVLGMIEAMMSYDNFRVRKLHTGDN